LKEQERLKFTTTAVS